MALIWLPGKWSQTWTRRKLTGEDAAASGSQQGPRISRAPQTSSWVTQCCPPGSHSLSPRAVCRWYLILKSRAEVYVQVGTLTLKREAIVQSLGEENPAICFGPLDLQKKTRIGKWFPEHGGWDRKGWSCLKSSSHT